MPLGSRQIFGHATAYEIMSDTPRFSKQWLNDGMADLLVCLRFCTRVPIPAFSFEKSTPEISIAAAANMLPIAGAVIGAAAALILWAATKLGLPASLAALVTMAALAVLTGALHEDGLADFADSLGGTTPEQRLVIMKDSRIGTFGGLALVISFLARVMSLAVLTEQSLALAGAVLIAAAASSRSFALLPLYLLAPARAEGLGAAAAPIKDRPLAVAGIATLFFSLLPLVGGASLARVLSALIVSAAATYGMIRLTRRLIQGQTGDIAGAVQQITEIATYLVFTSRL